MRVEASRAGERRTRMGCGAALLTALLVVVLVVAVSAGLFLIAPGSSQVAASYIHAQPGAQRWDGHGRLTILLLGCSGDAASSSTDMMMLASYEPGTGQVQMLSIPPNLWVTIPGFGEGPIGNAYADGGVRLALVTVQGVLHIPIPYYAVVKPRTFAQIVDALGGVTVHVPQSVSAGGRTFAAGARHLDGSAARAYSTLSQADAQGVVDGMDRQQSLLLALRHQSVGPESFFHVPTIVNALGGDIATNFPYDQVVDLVRTLGSLPAGRFHRTSLSYLTDTVTVYNSSSGEVMLPDWQHIRALAARLFPFTAPGGAVEVVNGTGVPGQAVALASWLRSDHLRVKGYATGRAAGYGQTAVEVPARATAAERSLAATVATLLQIPVQTVGGSATMHVTVRLGRDYQDPTQQ